MILLHCLLIGQPNILYLFKKEKMSATKTILEYLTSDNPNLVYDPNQLLKSHKQLNTTNAQYQNPKYILRWEDFRYDSLEAIYNGRLRKLLNLEISNCIDRSTIPRLPFCEIHDEDSLETLLIKWNHSVVSDALRVTQKSNKAQGKMYMVRGGQAKRIPNFLPDWAAVLRVSTRQRTSSILTGDTKVSWKWNSRRVELGEVDEVFMGSRWLEPIKQIFSYCRKLNVRYGYIITDEELVVTRILPFLEDHLKSPANTQESEISISSPKNPAIISEPSKKSLQNLKAEDFKNGTLEFKAIPWKIGASDDALTINLALWWLHMMALENNETCYDYPPLAEDPGAQKKDSGFDVEPSHTGAKRSREESPDEDDEDEQSYANRTPQQIPMRQTRSHTKRHQTDGPACA